MAQAGACVSRCCVRWPDSGGAPAWQGLWGRPLATGSCGCRRRLRWPRCLALARASVPAPWRARVADAKEPATGNASGRVGLRCPRWVWRRSRGARLSSLRPSATPKARRSQGRSQNVAMNPGSPEGCSQPSSPPLCRGVMTFILKSVTGAKHIMPFILPIHSRRSVKSPRHLRVLRAHTGNPAPSSRRPARYARHSEAREASPRNCRTAVEVDATPPLQWHSLYL